MVLEFCSDSLEVIIVIFEKLSNCVCSGQLYSYWSLVVFFCALENWVLWLLLWSILIADSALAGRERRLATDRISKTSGLCRERWKQVHCRIFSSIVVRLGFKLTFSSLKLVGFPSQPQLLLLLAEMICAHWSLNRLKIHCNLGSRIILSLK